MTEGLSLDRKRSISPSAGSQTSSAQINSSASDQTGDSSHNTRDSSHSCRFRRLNKALRLRKSYTLSDTGSKMTPSQAKSVERLGCRLELLDYDGTDKARICTRLLSLSNGQMSIRTPSRFSEMAKGAEKEDIHILTEKQLETFSRQGMGSPVADYREVIRRIEEDPEKSESHLIG